MTWDQGRKGWVFHSFNRYILNVQAINKTEPVPASLRQSLDKKNLKQIWTPSLLCYHNLGKGQKEIEDMLQTYLRGFIPFGMSCSLKE